MGLLFPYIYKNTGSVEIVSFADGTEDQIGAMLAAADAGKINLSDYWSVGDERAIALKATTDSEVGETHAAQDSVWVIMDTGENSGYVFADNTPVHFVVGMKDCFNETGYMNSTNTNAGSWNGCFRRRWCNNTFPNSFEDSTRALFKSFKTISYDDTLGGTITLTDNFALFAEKEIFGTRTYSNATEANALKQIKYYEVTANRIKKVNGAAAYWWERSPHSGGSNSFCSAANGGGGAEFNGASAARGLAPFGCI